MPEKLQEQTVAKAEEVEVGPNTTDRANVSITKSSYWDNKRAILLATYINMALFQNGFDEACAGGFQGMVGFLMVFGYKDPSLAVGYGITTKVQQIIGSFTVLFLGVGAAIVGPLAHYLGRRRAMQLGCILVLLSITLQIVCTDLGGLYAGRIFLGLSNGILSVTSYLYVQEIAPANVRTLNFLFSEVWVAFGVLIGSIINNATSTILDRRAYQIPLAILYIFPVIIFFGHFFIHDTPRWLAEKGRNAEALKSLRFYRDAVFTDVQIEEEFAEILHTIQADLELSSNISYLTIWKRPHLKRTLSSIGVCLVSTALGAPFISQYGVYYFELSGDTHAFRDAVIETVVGLVGSALMPLISGRVGKRPIFLVACVLQALCMLGMAISYTLRGTDRVSGRVIVSMTIMYYFIYSASTAPFSFQVAGEIPSQALRAFTFGTACFVTYICGFLVTFTAPYFVNPTALNWGARYGFIWVGSGALATIFVYFCLPETNQRTLEEIDECYLAGVSPRKFASYECVRSRQAREQAYLSHKDDTALGESFGEEYQSDHTTTAAHSG